MRRHPQRGQPGLAHFKHFLRFWQAFEAPAAVGFPHQGVAALTQLACGAVRQRFGSGRQQNLPRPRQVHQARRQGFGQAFHFYRLGTQRHRVVAVFPLQDFAHMQAGAHLQGLLQGLFTAQVTQAAGIVQGKTQPVDGAFENQQQAIAAVNQPPAPALLQVQHDTVVAAKQRGSGGIANALDQLGGVHQIGEQQGAHLRFAGTVHQGSLNPATRRNHRLGAWRDTAQGRLACTSAPMRFRRPPPPHRHRC